MPAGLTRRAFYKGLAALLPTVLTVFILVKAYQLVSSTVGVTLTHAVQWFWDVTVGPGHERLGEWLVPVMGTLLALIIAFLVAVFLGFILASFIGRKTWAFVERRLLNFPVISLIYPSIKQITDFVFGEHQVSFRRVGIIEYPRKGIYTIGFITGEAFGSVQQRTGRQMVTLFIPSSPAPFTGYCVQVFRDEVMELDIPIDAAIRYTVSGGVILPISEGGSPGELFPLTPANQQQGAPTASENEHQEE